MKSVEFTFAGIDFKVDLYIDETNKCLDSVVGVYFWNRTTHSYEYLDCEKYKFEKDMEDQLNDAIAEMYDNARLAHEDMMFDAYREEQALKAMGGK